MIRFENVHKTYKTGTDALRGVSFKIEDGEFVFVIGKSGSGKSTLMKCITREERPTEGFVIIDKFCISKMPRALIPVLRRQIGIIYQDFRLIETKTVEENIAFAGEIIGVPRKKLHQMVDIVLGAVGLRDKASAMPLELSGGEQQRVAIARAMLNNPKLIVADEPTGNLDPETSESIMALLQEINRQGTTVIVCTHDSNMVDRMKKRVIEVDGGLIIRDECAAGYAAVVKHWPPDLPKSMQDEFEPEVVSLEELNLEEAQPKKEEPLPVFPGEEEAPAKKEEKVAKVILEVVEEKPKEKPEEQPKEETVEKPEDSKEENVANVSEESPVEVSEETVEDVVAEIETTETAEPESSVSEEPEVLKSETEVADSDPDGYDDPDIPNEEEDK